MSAGYPKREVPWDDAFDDGPKPPAVPPISAIWLVALFMTVFAAWFPFPGAAYWKSDDFLALQYTAEFGRALSDFSGNQYGLEGMVWFYRPLVSLSFAIEQVLGGGPSPMLSHASNACAHGLSAVLVVLLARRCFGALTAFLCGLVWAMAPSHAGAVLWAVGRVDSHTVLWILLATWCLARTAEGRGDFRLPALLAGAAALASKELGIVLPGIALVLGYGLAPVGVGRWKNVVRVALPMLLLVAGYFVLRWVLFGRWVGGYEGESLQWGDTLEGFGRFAMYLINPLAYAGQRFVEMPEWAWYVGFVPFGLGLLMGIARRRFAAQIGLVLLFVGACVPLVYLLRHSDNLVNLRYAYLAMVALAVFVGLGGWIPTLLFLAVQMLPWLELRSDYATTSGELAEMHRRLIEDAEDLPEGEPVFVVGLPRANEAGTVLAMHLGVDRMLAPPFTQTTTQLLAMRPLSEIPRAFRVPFDDDRGLPLATTLQFEGPKILARLPRMRAPSRVDVQIEGSLVLTTKRIHSISSGAAAPDAASTFLSVPGQEGRAFRLTLFCGMGYLSTVIPSDADARFDLISDLLQFQYAPGVTTDLWGHALRIPTTFDLEPRFPLLVEAGAVVDTPAGPVFEPQVVASDFVWLEFDRKYAELIAGRAPSGG